LAGIAAASVTKTHAAAGADVAAVGFLANEQITLSASPAGSGYQWSITIPADSSPARSALDDDTDAAPKFTPDVAGFYTLSVLVDGATTYVLRLAVVSVSIVRQCEGLNFAPMANSQIPTPQTGFTVFNSSDLPGMAKKDSTGTVTAL
jgi:hypothetical protein